MSGHRRHKVPRAPKAIRHLSSSRSRPSPPPGQELACGVCGSPEWAATLEGIDVCGRCRDTLLDRPAASRAGQPAATAPERSKPAHVSHLMEPADDRHGRP